MRRSSTSIRTKLVASLLPRSNQLSNRQMRCSMKRSPSRFPGTGRRAPARSGSGRRTRESAGGSGMCSPTRSTTTLFRLSYRIRRATPPSVSNASAWPRRNVSSVWSSVNRAYIARDHDRTSTKRDSERVAAPTWTLPKWPRDRPLRQCTQPCSGFLISQQWPPEQSRPRDTRCRTGPSIATAELQSRHGLEWRPLTGQHRQLLQKGSLLVSLEDWRPGDSLQ